MSGHSGGSCSVKIVRESVLGSSEQCLKLPPDCAPQGNTHLTPPCHIATGVATGMQSDEVRMSILGIIPGRGDVV